MINSPLTDADLTEILSGVVDGVTPTLQEISMAHELRERRKADSAEAIGYIIESIYEGGDGRDIDYYESDLKGLPIGTKVYAATQPAPERERIRREHAEWSDATFGNVGPIGPLKHLSKEALEAAAEPNDLSEWADMQFLLWDAQRRMGISDELITRAMIEKLAVNKQRHWPEPQDGEPREHVKTPFAQSIEDLARDPRKVADELKQKMKPAPEVIHCYHYHAEMVKYTRAGYIGTTNKVRDRASYQGLMILIGEANDCTVTAICSLSYLGESVE